MKAFLEQLHARLELRRTDGKGLALLLVDCGVIGRIDTVWGYAAGDAVREHFGSRLRENVLREGDLLGEVGRDRIACALDGVKSDGVALLAAEKILGALDAPVLAGDDEVYARPCIGIAVFPEHGDSEVSLLQHARAACRTARDRSERVAVHAEAQEAPEIERLRAESALRGAIVTEALELMFQPQIEFRTGLISGVETLLSMRGAGIVPMREAVDVAQSAGRANEFTGRILNAAMRSCADFREAAGLNLRFGVNLTSKSLQQPGLPDAISRALDTWNLRPGRLVLEVNDAGTLEANPEACDALQRLNGIGARLSIDDGGAGYAALAFLATLPFDEVKLDLSRVPEMLSQPKQDGLVQSMIELAHRLKLEVVAEGVDSEAVAARVKELGCDYMQGRHVSPLLDAAGVIREFGR